MLLHSVRKYSVGYIEFPMTSKVYCCQDWNGLWLIILLFWDMLKNTLVKLYLYHGPPPDLKSVLPEVSFEQYNYYLQHQQKECQYLRFRQILRQKFYVRN